MGNQKPPKKVNKKRVLFLNVRICGGGIWLKVPKVLKVVKVVKVVKSKQLEKLGISTLLTQ